MDPLSGCSQPNPRTLTALPEHAAAKVRRRLMRTCMCAYVCGVGRRPRRLLTLTLPQVLLSRGRALRAAGSLCTRAAGCDAACKGVSTISRPNRVKQRHWQTWTAQTFMLAAIAVTAATAAAAAPAAAAAAAADVIDRPKKIIDVDHYYYY